MTIIRMHSHRAFADMGLMRKYKPDWELEESGAGPRHEACLCPRRRTMSDYLKAPERHRVRRRTEPVPRCPQMVRSDLVPRRRARGALVARRGLQCLPMEPAGWIPNHANGGQSWGLPPLFLQQRRRGAAPHSCAARAVPGEVLARASCLGSRDGVSCSRAKENRAAGCESTGDDLGCVA